MRTGTIPYPMNRPTLSANAPRRSGVRMMARPVEMDERAAALDEFSFSVDNAKVSDVAKRLAIPAPERAKPKSVKIENHDSQKIKNPTKAIQSEVNVNLQAPIL